MRLKKHNKPRSNKLKRRSIRKGKRGSPGYVIGPAEQREIAAIISNGGSLQDCADYLGIDRKTLWNHQKRDIAFASLISKASATGKISLLQKVHGSKDWKAAAWMLGKRYGDQFGDNGRNTAENVEQFITLLSKAKKAIVQVLLSYDIADLIIDKVCRAVDNEGAPEEVTDVDIEM